MAHSPLRQKRNYAIQQEYKREKVKKHKHPERIFEELSVKYFISTGTIKQIVYGAEISKPK